MEISMKSTYSLKREKVGGIGWFEEEEFCFSQEISVRPRILTRNYVMKTHVINVGRPNHEYSQGNSNDFEDTPSPLNLY